jgi:hypothetical protein
MKKKMQRTSAEYHEILRLLRGFFQNDENKVEYWLETKNLNLGGASPNFLIEIGRERKLLKTIKAMLSENERPVS